MSLSRGNLVDGETIHLGYVDSEMPGYFYIDVKSYKSCFSPQCNYFTYAQHFLLILCLVRASFVAFVVRMYCCF